MRHRFTLLATLVTALVTVPFAAPAAASTAPPPDPHHHHHHHHGPGDWGPGPGDWNPGNWNPGNWGHGQSNGGPPHDIKFRATLTGWNELPHGSGDPDAGGSALLDLSPTNRLCYALWLHDISGRITGGHIHLGVATSEGPVVLTLSRPPAGQDETCQQISSSLAGALGRTPSYYYINVHSTRYPDGAVRGQLQRG